jgi:hypothetical protein
MGFAVEEIVELVSPVNRNSIDSLYLPSSLPGTGTWVLLMSDGQGTTQTENLLRAIYHSCEVVANLTVQQKTGFALVSRR